MPAVRECDGKPVAPGTPQPKSLLLSSPLGFPLSTFFEVTVQETDLFLPLSLSPFLLVYTPHVYCLRYVSSFMAALTVEFARAIFEPSRANEDGSWRSK